MVYVKGWRFPISETEDDFKQEFDNYLSLTEANLSRKALKNPLAMLDCTTQVTTSDLKYSPMIGGGCQNGLVTFGINAESISNGDRSMVIPPKIQCGLSANDLLSWDVCDQFPDSSTKYDGPIKLETKDDQMEIDSLLGHDPSNYAELKPLQLEYDDEESTTLSGLVDPILTGCITNIKTSNIINRRSQLLNGSSISNNNNNNCKSITDLNLKNFAPSSTTTSSSSRLSYLFLGGSTGGNSGGGGSTANSDITSSGSTSPPGLTKLENIDFTASQDAFDDLDSIVGINSIDNDDLKVPSFSNTDSNHDWMDLDAWIENTAQSIKPLLSDSTTDSLFPTVINSVQGRNGPTNSTLQANNIQSSQSNDAQYTKNETLPLNGSTLHALLMQGNLLPNISQSSCKLTQLQQRDGNLSANQNTTQTPPFSILQSRLTHGSASSTLGMLPPPHTTAPNNISSNMITVDSTYDIIKSAAAAAAMARARAMNGMSNVSAAASTPSSTQFLSYVMTPPTINDSQPSSSATPGGVHNSLQQRLAEMSGIPSIKSRSTPAKNNKVRRQIPGLNCTSSSLGGNGVTATAVTVAIDNGKKMMHHCSICNRGFLNKSNIKVHLRTHTGEKPFKCEHCSKAFRQKAHLLKHMSIHKRISRD